MYFPLMNDYIICIGMRKDILHDNIITTCLRQYLFTIGVLRWFLAVSLITTLAAHYRESLHAAWHGNNQLVHNNHPTEAEALTSLAILFGWIVTALLFLSKTQLSHQRAFI